MNHTIKHYKDLVSCECSSNEEIVKNILDGTEYLENFFILNKAMNILDEASVNFEVIKGFRLNVEGLKDNKFKYFIIKTNDSSLDVDEILKLFERSSFKARKKDNFIKVNI